MVYLLFRFFVVSCASMATGDDVLSAMEDREQAIKSVSVQLSADCFGFSGPEQPVLQFHWDGSTVVEHSGRYRFEGTRRAAAGNPLRQVQVFDGKRRREASGEGERLTNGREGTNSYPLFVPLNPWLLVSQFDDGVEASQYLRERNPTVADAEWPDGAGKTRSVFIVEGASRLGVDGKLRKVQAYVDPSVGFAILRKTMLARAESTENWMPSWELTLSDYAEITPGLWLPHRAERTIYEFPSEDRFQPYQRIEMRCDNWALNAEVADATFEFQFPAGVAVNDETTGKLYMSGTIKDPVIAAQVRDSQALLARQRWLRWLSIGAGIVAVVGVAIVLRFVLRRAAPAA